LTPAPGATGDAERGRVLFTDSRIMAPAGCGSCHTIRGVPAATGLTGPNLTNVALRPTLAGDSIQNSQDNLTRWIMNAPSMKPGIIMPAFPQLTEAQARDIVAFLYSQPYNEPAR
jgi:cytochrome c oxidase subunit 2